METMNSADWLTKEEAAAILGVSGRAIERKAQGGKIATRQAERRGQRPTTLYASADVEQLRSQQKASERGPSELATLPPAVPLSHGHADAATHLAALLATIANSSKPAGSRDPLARRWLTVEEAAQDSGLSGRFLRKLCRLGELTAIWDEAQWKIASDSLRNWTPAGGAHCEQTLDSATCVTSDCPHRAKTTSSTSPSQTESSQP